MPQKADPTTCPGNCSQQIKLLPHPLSMSGSRVCGQYSTWRRYCSYPLPFLHYGYPPPPPPLSSNIPGVLVRNLTENSYANGHVFLTSRYLARLKWQLSNMQFSELCHLADSKICIFTTIHFIKCLVHLGYVGSTIWSNETERDKLIPWHF